MCPTCGSSRVSWVTGTEMEVFDDGQRLVLEEVPAVECAACGARMMPFELSGDVRVVLGHMEQHGPDRARFDDPRWSELISQNRQAVESSIMELGDPDADLSRVFEVDPDGGDAAAPDASPAWAPEPWPTSCDACEAPAQWIDYADAMACVACDRWLEPVCHSGGCPFCTGRPPYPSQHRGP